MRMTYGWQRKRAKIKTDQWVAGTGLDKSTGYPTLRELIERKMVGRDTHHYFLNKKYNQWIAHTPKVVRSNHFEPGWVGVTTKGGYGHPPIGGQEYPPDLAANPHHHSNPHGPKDNKETIKERSDQNTCKDCNQKFTPLYEHHAQCRPCFLKSQQPKPDLMPEPCTQCQWPAYQGYTGMDENNVCQDCRQHEDTNEQEAKKIQ